MALSLYVCVHRFLLIMHAHTNEQACMRNVCHLTSPVMQEHIDVAIQLNPNEANLYFFLGMWCFEVRKVE